MNFSPEKSAESLKYFTKDKLNEIAKMMDLADEHPVDPDEYERIARDANPDIFENLNEICGDNDFMNKAIQHYIRLHSIINGCTEVKQ